MYPPAPKQRATMALSRNKADDGIEFPRDQQYPQFGWLVNVSCRNVGTAVTAKKVPRSAACSSPAGGPHEFSESPRPSANKMPGHNPLRPGGIEPQIVRRRIAARLASRVGPRRRHLGCL